MEKLANKILNKLDEASDNDNGGKAKGSAGIIEKLMKENFGKDNDSQKKMAEAMGKLAEADDADANKFMKAMDEMAGEYDMKEGFKKVKEALKSAKK